jgi:hypothetical protein
MDKHCVECTEKVGQEKKDNNKLYDVHYRNQESKEIYHSKEWEHLTEECKYRFKGLDIYSLFVLGKVEYGNLSHHIETITKNKARIYDLDNLIYLTSSNHNSK